MYHWETDQEDFLVLAGEAVLIVEGEERPLRQWDFVHCPPETKHVIVGPARDLCGARGRRPRSSQQVPTGAAIPWMRLRYAMVPGSRRRRRTRSRPTPVQKREPTPYREGWLPE